MSENDRIARLEVGLTETRRRIEQLKEKFEGAERDAYLAQQEEREELLALARNMANPGELHGSLADTWVTRHRAKARDILAKVDARRGRGGR